MNSMLFKKNKNVNFAPLLPYFCPRGFPWRILRRLGCLWTPLVERMPYFSHHLFIITVSNSRK